MDDKVQGRDDQVFNTKGDGRLGLFHNAPYNSQSESVVTSTTVNTPQQPFARQLIYATDPIGKANTPPVTPSFLPSKHPEAYHGKYIAQEQGTTQSEFIITGRDVIESPYRPNGVQLDNRTKVNVMPPASPKGVALPRIQIYQIQLIQAEKENHSRLMREQTDQDMRLAPRKELGLHKMGGRQMPPNLPQHPSRSRGPSETSKLPARVSQKFQDYQMQLMLLEQQNKKRLMMARQEDYERRASQKRANLNSPPSRKGDWEVEGEQKIWKAENIQAREQNSNKRNGLVDQLSHKCRHAHCQSASSLCQNSRNPINLTQTEEPIEIDNIETESDSTMEGDWDHISDIIPSDPPKSPSGLQSPPKGPSLTTNR